jgi:hypothetical protein
MSVRVRKHWAITWRGELEGDLHVQSIIIHANVKLALRSGVPWSVRLKFIEKQPTNNPNMLTLQSINKIPSQTFRLCSPAKTKETLNINIQTLQSIKKTCKLKKKRLPLVAKCCSHHCLPVSPGQVRLQRCNLVK